jgi:hypothetical protein
LSFTDRDLPPGEELRQVQVLEVVWVVDAVNLGQKRRLVRKVDEVRLQPLEYPI